ncbi:hypothetical protein [Arsukibacterium sp.]|uniref:hypothetical protein n=1 Tax=Arsukibacterium sp. TaxID=1977258 RepID=UPI00299EDB85|nr:hypothetical protein [Arsukibacterium sp.]MDX1539167.1 hypothetical protein [Arsukibacterium sp.]
MQYDFYPSFYQHCGRKTQVLVIVIFLILSFLPLIVNFGWPKQINYMLLIFTPMLALVIALFADFLLSRYLLPRYLKPFRITASQLFIPKWLIYKRGQSEQKDLIIDAEIIRRIILHTYQIKNRHSVDNFIDAICIKTWTQDIYLDGKKLMFNGVANEKSKLLEAFKLLACETLFEHKNNYGDARMLYTVFQGRHRTVYTAMYFLMFVIAFGSFLTLVLW